jgi:hypothetical protein
VLLTCAAFVIVAQAFMVAPILAPAGCIRLQVTAGKQCRPRYRVHPDDARYCLPGSRALVTRDQAGISTA